MEFFTFWRGRGHGSKYWMRREKRLLWKFDLNKEIKYNFSLELSAAITTGFYLLKSNEKVDNLNLRWAKKHLLDLFRKAYSSISNLLLWSKVSELLKLSFKANFMKLCLLLSSVLAYKHDESPTLCTFS